MIVILPSHEGLDVPADVITVIQLKAHLASVTGIPAAVQRLFVGEIALPDECSLGSLSEASRIDLVIAVGDRFVIGREEIRDQLAALPGEVFVTRGSRDRTTSADDAGEFFAELIENALNAANGKNKRTDIQKKVAPFYAAFEKHKGARLERLRRIRAKLAPGPVVVSTFNWGFHKLLENWTASCDRHGIACRTFTLLFPTDKRADELARNLGFQTYFDGESYGDLPENAAAVFGDTDFRRFLFAKLATTQDMLATGADILRQDIDVVWLRNPLPLLANLMEGDELDFLFMFDGPNPRFQPLHYNSGFVFIRNSPLVRQTWQLIFSNFAQIFADGGEQPTINIVMNCLSEHGLRTARMPEDAFVNGHVISRAKREGTPLPDTAAVVHASWTHNIDVKFEHLKKYELWYLQDAGAPAADGALPTDNRGSNADDRRQDDRNGELAMTDVLVQAQNVDWRRHKKKLYAKASPAAHALQVNEMGLTILGLCDGTRTIKGIVARLAWMYEDRKRRLAADVISTLRAFLAHGLINQADPIVKLPGWHRLSGGNRRSSALTARPKVFGVGWPFKPSYSSNSSRKPKYFDWTSNADDATVPVTVCLGGNIRKAMAVPGPKIAWLVESPAISDFLGHLSYIRDNLNEVTDAFDIILSADREFCRLHPKIQYHPAGSNLPWVPEDDYRIYRKTKLCSMIASAKRMVAGHHIRQDYAFRFKDRLDLYGGACGSSKLVGELPHLSKIGGLAPYMFSVAMENCRTSLYYSEKLSDCFVTGTVPIYWGSDDIGEIFDVNGIIKLDDKFDLDNLRSEFYYDMMPSIKNNFDIARNLESSDDLLYNKYILEYL